MDTLRNVLRSIRGETKSRPDQLAVFREFLGHLERINKRVKRPRAAPRRKAKAKRKG